jgi:hypothetical protein
MLSNWVPHEFYQKKLLSDLNILCENERSRVVSLEKALSKLYLLDLDNLLLIIKPLYSGTRLPSQKPTGYHQIPCINA